MYIYQISLKEVQFHLMNARDLAQRIAQETCPPRIVYEADYTADGIARLNCKIQIHGATIATTDQSVFFRISVRPPGKDIFKLIVYLFICVCVVIMFCLFP